MAAGGAAGGDRPVLAYLAGGRLHLVGADGRPRRVESGFAESIRERHLQIDQRHAWKGQGRGAQFLSGRLLWGGEGAGGAVNVALTSLARGPEAGAVLYAVETQDIAGVLALSRHGEERRLFHDNNRRVRHLSGATGHDTIACSVAHETGTASIAVMKADGSELAEVTEGDSVDQAPSWVPGTRALLFQSAGIGRDREGRLAGLGPFGVRRLDLDRGEIEVLAEEPGQDLLGPRVAANGALYYIRRPWTGAARASFWGATRDFLLFPARLLYALFQWLNFFSARYSGKPLTTAGGPRRQGADLRQMMVWGNLIDAEQAAAASAGENPDLVPASWQLVRRQGERREVLARGVLSFDLCADGSVVYTNGSAIYRLDPTGGGRERLCADAQIEQVVVIE